MRREQAESTTIPADAVAPSRRPARPVELRPEHLYKAVGLLFALALVFHYFADLARVLLIVFAAAILAVAFNAVVTLFPANRRWVTALLGVLIMAAIGTALWFGAPALLAQLRGLANRVPDIQAQVGSWEQQLRRATGLNIDLMGERAAAVAQSIFAGGGNQSMLGRAAGALEILFLPLIILFGGLFAVGNPNDRLLLPLLRAVPRERRPAFQRMFELLGMRLLGWVKGTLVSMLVVGVLSTVVLYLIGIRYALLLGVLTGVAEIVPLVGPWVAGIAAVLVAFMEDPSKALLTAIAMLGIQQLESNLITPMVMSRVAEVHPFVTLFAIFLFGTLFGFLGVLLAVPLVLLFWTVIQVLWVERAIDTDEDPIAPVVEE